MGEAPIEVDEKSVKVTVGGVELLPISEDQLRKEQKNRAFWQSFAAAVATGLDAGLSSYSTSTTRGYVGSTPIRISTTYRDGYAAMQARQRGSELQAAIASESAGELRRIDEISLKRNTLKTGDSLHATVEFELPKKTLKGLEHPATFSITAGGQTHKIDALIVKKTKGN
jgi:hypothetical protein